MDRLPTNLGQQLRALGVSMSPRGLSRTVLRDDVPRVRSARDARYFDDLIIVGLAALMLFQLFF